MESQLWRLRTRWRHKVSKDIWNGVVKEWIQVKEEALWKERKEWRRLCPKTPHPCGLEEKNWCVI
jgi:hypothetical protein